MKPVSALETSVLTLLAENQNISPADYQALLSELGPDAREIAEAIRQENAQVEASDFEPSESAKKTARALVRVR